MRVFTATLIVALCVTIQAAPPENGLVLWLDAGDLDGDGAPDARQETPPVEDGGRVGTWVDRSPRRHEAKQAAPAAQPALVADALGGMPALRFDGNDWLSLGAADALPREGRKPFTLIAAFQAEAGKLGTFLSRGGGPEKDRAWQFYAAPGKVGAVAYGRRQEHARPGGLGLAVLRCRGERAEILAGGRRLITIGCGNANSTVDVLVGARRKGSDGTGTYYPLQGDLSEMLFYARALTDDELGKVTAWLTAKYGIEVAVPAKARRIDVARDAFGAAELLLDRAQQNCLSDADATVAADLLGRPDPFVRGMAEWALAMRVGGDNNKQVARWPGDDPPDWYRRWAAVPASAYHEMDWVREAVSLGIHRDAGKLAASIERMARRAERMGADAASLAPLLTQARGADASAARGLWLRARRHMRGLAFAQARLNFDQIVFTKRFTAHTVRNITRSYPWKHKPGGDICVAGLQPDAACRNVLGGRLGRGFVWGLDLWWDADRVVFSYAKQAAWPPAVDTAHYKIEGDNALALRRSHEPLHLFEARLDGSPPRQLTDHKSWNDLEPTYCANGDIVFASDRCGRSAECGTFTYDHANVNLYRLPADGSPVRQLTDSKDIDRYPHSLDNGLIAYTHWEYQERHFMEVHSVWTVRPDGTMADAAFKHHMRAPLALRDTRGIPGSRGLVSIATGHHTFAFGPVVLLDPSRGLNSVDGIRLLTPGVRPQEGPSAGAPVDGGGVRDAGGLYQTPFAVGNGAYLVSYAYARPKCTAPAGADSNGFGIYLIDEFGNKELVHRDRLLSCTYPIPLRKRRRPATVASVVEEGVRTATCYVLDVHAGMPGVPRGTVKHIRVSQHIGWPLDPVTGKKPYMPGNAHEKKFGYWSWSPVRVIGTAPVEADGSAHFRVPADTALYFQALDGEHMEVRRMRAMASFKAGEVRGCRGCHESAAKAPAATARAPLALRRPATTLEPPHWGAERPLGYEWLVQPILDKHCVKCHAGKERKAGLDLTAARGADGFVQSFRSLFGKRVGGDGPVLVSTANRFGNADVSQPKQFGSHVSPLIAALRGAKHRERVKLTEQEWVALVTWVDCNAPYYGNFFDKRPPDGGKPRRDVEPRLAGVE